ncbi:MAG TPA: PadR family transcriptional regulator [Mobilitalea sp.]|nr:PadR family transcriptional regulator [Mobilitalea sp.]
MPRNNSLELGELTDTMYYILLALMEPKHGYLIMKFIETLTDGKFCIGPASLYTIIKKLLAAQLIMASDKEDDIKKTYIITEEGMQLLRDEVKRRKNMVSHAEIIFMKRGVNL